MGDIGALFKDIEFILKIIEAVLLLVGCILLDFVIWASGRHVYNLGVVAFAGFMLIILILIIAYCNDSPDELMELIILISGAIIHLVVGIWLIIDYAGDYSNGYGLALGIIALVLACIFFFDAVYSGSSSD